MVFYIMEISRDRRFVEGSENNDWKSVTCSENPAHRRAGERITALALDVLSWNVVDFSRTMLSDIIITDHALDVLQRANLTGFSVKPTIVSGGISHRDYSKYPALWEFVITGSGGMAHKNSGIVKLRECGACGLVRYSAFRNGIWVDASTYDGSDFFAVTEYPKYVFVSERAKGVMERNNLTNLAFAESTQLKWPKGVVEPT